MRKSLISILIVVFLCGVLCPNAIQANELILPVPGTMVPLSPTFNPPILKGIKVFTDNPFKFDFVVSQGDTTSAVASAKVDSFKEESNKLIKYFLAALTTPEKDLWVNLSPYEKDRIVPDSFGQTEMGRDLLAQDYLLKQVAASLVYPEGVVGKAFWKRVYEESATKHVGHLLNVPISTFNKVWIVPNKAVVYENAKAGTAYVVESSLKVMLEDDYLSSKINTENKTVETRFIASQTTKRTTQDIIRDIVIPQLTKEVNEGANFVQLRQVYNSLILATWYKKKIQDSILTQVYADKNKVAGILSSSNASIGDPKEIYQRYLEAFKKGAYNYIKEEQDPISKQMIPRKYFSGGINATNFSSQAMVVTNDEAMIGQAPVGKIVSVELGVGAIENNDQTSSPKEFIYIVEEGTTKVQEMAKSFYNFKLGDPEEIEHYAAIMKDRIVDRLGEQIKQAPSQWMIVYTRTRGMLPVSSQMARLVAKELGLDISLVDNPNIIGQIDYHGLESNQERQQALMGRYAISDPMAVRGKNIIFIDDTFVSGNTAETIEAIYRQAGNKSYHSFFLMQLRNNTDFSFERKFELMGAPNDVLNNYVRILNHEDSSYPAKLMTKIFYLEYNDFNNLLRLLTPSAVFKLYLYALRRLDERSDRIALMLGPIVKKNFPLHLWRSIKFLSILPKLEVISEKYNYRVPLTAVEEVLAVLNIRDGAQLRQAADANNNFAMISDEKKNAAESLFSGYVWADFIKEMYLRDQNMPRVVNLLKSHAYAIDDRLGQLVDFLAKGETLEGNILKKWRSFDKVLLEYDLHIVLNQDTKVGTNKNFYIAHVYKVARERTREIQITKDRTVGIIFGAKIGFEVFNNPEYKTKAGGWIWGGNYLFIDEDALKKDIKLVNEILQGARLFQNLSYGTKADALINRWFKENFQDKSQEYLQQWMEVSFVRHELTHALHDISVGNFRLKVDFRIPMWKNLSQRRMRMASSEAYAYLVQMRNNPHPGGVILTLLPYFIRAISSQNTLTINKGEGVPEMYAAMYIFSRLMTKLNKPNATIDEILERLLFEPNLSKMAGQLIRESQEGMESSLIEKFTIEDSAQLSPGGIDFNAEKMNLETQNAGESIKFEMNPEMLKQLQDAPGFTPVIINIQPMTNLRLFLGLPQK